MMIVCMLSIKLISDDMAEFAFEFDLFSFFLKIKVASLT